MPSNSQKTYFGRSMNRFAERKIQFAMYLLGKRIPAQVISVGASGAIVTVKFRVQCIYTLPNVTMPVCGFEYIRFPIQPGCLGEVIPADTYIGNVSGLGNSADPKLDTLPANLSALAFQPLGNQNWSATDDSNAVVIYGNGNDGVILRDGNKTCVFKLTSTGIVITLGSMTATLNSSGLTIANGDVIAGTISLKTHVHSGVTTGSGDTGPPV